VHGTVRRWDGVLISRHTTFRQLDFSHLLSQGNLRIASGYEPCTLFATGPCEQQGLGFYLNAASPCATLPDGRCVSLFRDRVTGAAHKLGGCRELANSAAFTITSPQSLGGGKQRADNALAAVNTRAQANEARRRQNEATLADDDNIQRESSEKEKVTRVVRDVQKQRKSAISKVPRDSSKSTRS
jgi:hypothetical protein